MIKPIVLLHLSIEGNPFIIRFKTPGFYPQIGDLLGIEGNPFIIRFKTRRHNYNSESYTKSIEGNPFIIRFKTLPTCIAPLNNWNVKY